MVGSFGRSCHSDRWLVSCLDATQNLPELGSSWGLNNTGTGNDLDVNCQLRRVERGRARLAGRRRDGNYITWLFVRHVRTCTMHVISITHGSGLWSQRSCRCSDASAIVRPRRSPPQCGRFPPSMWSLSAQLRPANLAAAGCIGALSAFRLQRLSALLRQRNQCSTIIVLFQSMWLARKYPWQPVVHVYSDLADVPQALRSMRWSGPYSCLCRLSYAISL